jgi:hypothetical protein
MPFVCFVTMTPRARQPIRTIEQNVRWAEALSCRPKHQWQPHESRRLHAKSWEPARAAGHCGAKSCILVTGLRYSRPDRISAIDRIAVILVSKLNERVQRQFPLSIRKASKQSATAAKIFEASSRGTGAGPALAIDAWTPRAPRKSSACECRMAQSLDVGVEAHPSGVTAGSLDQLQRAADHMAAVGRPFEEALAAPAPSR